MIFFFSLAANSLAAKYSGLEVTDINISGIYRSIFILICQVSFFFHNLIIVSEYDQEIPQSQTADNPVAPRGRAAQTSRDTRKTN